MIVNYRSGFLRLAENAVRNEHNPQKAKKIMDRMEEVIPITVVPNQDWRYTNMMIQVSEFIADTAHYRQYADVLLKDTPSLLAKVMDQREQAQLYQVLLQIYDKKKDYGAAIDLLNRVQGQYPNDPGIQNEIKRFENLMKAPARPDTAKK
jgi:hypothetical protein